MRVRRLALVALMLHACNSTGVGNPAPASLQLAITRDDETVAPVGGAPGTAGAPADESGAPSTSGAPADLVGADSVGGMTDGGASAGGPALVGAGGANTDAPSDDAVLPRATIHNAILVIGAVRFLPCDTSDDGSVAIGPFLVDLLHGGTAPEIPAVSVPAGGFCGLDAPLAPAQAPSRLVGRSVYFDGQRVDGTPFRFYANVQATLRVRARAGVTWNGAPEGAMRSVFWALRPRQWLEPGELNALEATLLGDGTDVAAIDVERHPALLRLVRSRLAGRSTLYADANDDRAFDLADRDAILGDGVPDAD